MVAALFPFFRPLRPLRFLRSLLPRRVGNPLPTMHSLRAHGGQQGCPSRGSFPQRKPLRVVRSNGKLVISGRMADVCAELDRLAALEAAGPDYAWAPAR
jgi:hypothetical protein